MSMTCATATAGVVEQGKEVMVRNPDADADVTLDLDPSKSTKYNESDSDDSSDLNTSLSAQRPCPSNFQTRQALGRSYIVYYIVIPLAS